MGSINKSKFNMCDNNLGKGGVVYVTSGSGINLMDTYFLNNTALYGHDIYIVDGFCLNILMDGDSDDSSNNYICSSSLYHSRVYCGDEHVSDTILKNNCTGRSLLENVWVNIFFFVKN
jgi:hypothetical protein